MNSIKNALLQLHQRPIAYYPIYRKMTGSTTAGVLLSQLMYWFTHMKGKEFYKTDEEIMDETLLTPGELRTAKARVKSMEFVKTSRKGIPAKTFYYIDLDILFREINKYSIVESTKLDVTNEQDSDCEINPTNTETTQETTPLEFKNTHTQESRIPKNENEVKTSIALLPLDGPTVSSRRKILEVIEAYMTTQDFESTWDFLCGGNTVPAKPIILEWVSRAEYDDVKNFRLNKISGWIKNYQPKTTTNGHSTRKPAGQTQAGSIAQYVQF